MKNDQQDTIIPSGSEPDAHSGMPVRQDEVLTDKIYLLPISDRPFFPSQTLPIIINEKFWLETIERVGRTPQRLVGICLTRQIPEKVPGPDDFSAVGTVARIHHAQKIDGNVHFIAEGIRRFRVSRWISKKQPYLVQVEYLEPPTENKDRVKAYSHAIINTIKELLPLNPIYKEQLRVFLDRFNPDNASPLADFAALLTSAEGSQLQDILETLPLTKRMEKVLLLLRKEIEYAGMQANIRQKVEAQMSDQQKDFFLRQQLKAIQQELGISKDDKTVEVELFKNRLKDLVLSPEAQKRVDEELQKFSFLELGSPEYAVT